MSDIAEDIMVEKHQMDRRLEANLHPITRVFCGSDDGIIYYERHNADPLPISPGTPKLSRIDALRRCYATMRVVRKDAAKVSALEATILFGRPLSNTGLGITYKDYELQTLQAAKQSQQVEARLADEARARYSIGI